MGNQQGNDKNSKKPTEAPKVVFPLSDQFVVKKAFNSTGQFGSRVYLVSPKNDSNKLFALREIDVVKLVPARPLAEQNVNNVRQAVTSLLESDEIDKIKQHFHPNIVRIYNIIKQNSSVWCVMEYCEGGTLDDALRSRKNNLLDQKQIVQWFAQIVLAVNYFVSQKLKHCELTAKNIYLRSDSSVIKISDFCVRYVRSCVDRQLAVQDTAGAPLKPDFVYYAAPEVLTGLVSPAATDEKADVWSLGVLLYQLATLKLPFVDSSAARILDKIKRGDRADIPDETDESGQISSLVDRMLSEHRGDRPNLAKILRDKFIREEVAVLTGGRGWTAINREEEAALKKARMKSFIADTQVLKEEQLERSKEGQIEIFETDYCENFTTEGTISAPWFSAQSAIADLLIVDPPLNYAIVVCVNGDVIAVTNISVANQSRVLWRGVVNVPKSVSMKTSIEHAALEQPDEDAPDDFRIYVTLVEDRSGIFYANVAAMKNAFKPNEERQAVTVANKFFANKNRKFFGLAVCSEAQLLFCCDQSLNHDIGVWSTETKTMIARITHPGATGIEFQPLKCAVFYQPPADDDEDEDENSNGFIRLAVTDIEHSMVYIFDLELEELEDNLTEDVQVETLAKLGSKIGPFVNSPRGISFDLLGRNLFIADEGNSRIQIFSNNEDSEDEDNNDSEWRHVGTVPASMKSFLRTKFPGIGVLLEEPEVVGDLSDEFRPFIILADCWQSKVFAYFQPPAIPSAR